MRSRFVFLFLLTASTCWALTEENLSQQFAAASGGKLVVEVDFGNIDVTVGNDTEVAVTAHRKIKSDDEAREKEYVAAVPIVFSQEGNTVFVRARRPEERKHWGWSGNVTMDADYTVRVPKNFNADLRTCGGGISAAGVTGEVMANTSGGKLKFAQIRGPLDARTSGGSIALEACEGELSVDTSGGEINCEKSRGSLEARTSGGAIVVRDFTGDAEVKTSGGKLTLDNIIGAVSGKTAAGSIVLTLPNPVPDDVKVQTSAGSIEVSLPEKAAVDVDAKTGMGSVRTEIPMLATRARDNRLEGTLNGGGKALLLHTSVGSINIRSVPASTASR